MPTAKKTTETPQNNTADQNDEQAVTTTVFTSPSGSLIVYRDGQKVAAFVDGRFETTDPDVAAYLREHMRQIVQEQADGMNGAGRAAGA